MSVYSMQLREFIEQATQNQENLSHQERIEEGRKKLFNFDYPIFDENYRSVFETHFIRHFYMREIGFEVEGLFQFQLETWLNIHMPYFNKLYESELIEFNPMENTKTNITRQKTNDRTENGSRDSTIDSTTSGSSDSTSDSTGNNTVSTQKDGTKTNTDDDFKRNVHSDNPDSRLNLTTNDGQGVIEYASKIDEETKNNSQSSDTSETGSSTADSTDHSTSNTTANSTSNALGNETSTNTVKDIEDYVQTIGGKIGTQSYSSMLNEFRGSFIRIEKELFKEMNQLFMLVY